MSQNTSTSNHSSALELGRLLAEKRNQKGMSLEEAATRLKLAPEKVRALEKGDYKGLPELVYVRGFLRNYARLVGMDTAELNRYLESATPVARQDMSILEKGPHQKELASLENRKSFSGWIAVLLALVAVGGGIYFWQSKSIAQQEQKEATQSASSELVQTPVKNSSSNVAVIPMTQPQANPASATAASATVAAASAAAASGAEGEPVIAADELYIKPRYRTLMVVKDKTGKEVLNAIVAGGSEQRFRGGAPYDVRIGYVQGSTINYGGKQIDFGPYMVGRTTAVFKAGQ